MNVRRARNGLSVVLVTANGGSVTVIGLTSVEGGSNKQVTVNFSRNVVMCKLYLWDLVNAVRSRMQRIAYI